MPVWKHKKTIPSPDYNLINDEATRLFGKDLADLINKTNRNIYDDIQKMAYSEQTTGLPTADIEYAGKYYIHNDGTSSAADVMYACMDTGSGGYKWKVITTT